MYIIYNYILAYMRTHSCSILFMCVQVSVRVHYRYMVICQGTHMYVCVNAYIIICMHVLMCMDIYIHAFKYYVSV